MKNLFAICFFLFSVLPLGATQISDCRLRIETAKEVYASGEKIWFKSYMCSGEKNTSNILFVDLCGPGYIASSRMFYQQNQCWYGDMAIPDSLQTGVYVLRAYTTNQGSKAITVEHELIVVLNRFGKNGYNESLKSDSANARFVPKFLTGENSGNVQLTSNKSSFLPGQKAIFTLRGFGEELACGMSLSIRKVPDSFPPEEQNKRCRFSANYLADLEAAMIHSGGVTISGKVTYNNSGLPYANGLVLISEPDSVPKIAYASTNSSGSFQLALENVYGQHDYIIQTVNKREKLMIELDENRLPPPPVIPYYVPVWLENSQFAELTIRRANLHKAYSSNTTASEYKESSLFPFYGKPTHAVNTADYYPLNDFVEISRELLGFCRLRGNKTNRTLKLINAEWKQLMENPMVLVDGVPVTNIEDLIPLGSDKIRRVETQTNYRCFGNLYLEGVLSVTTFSCNFTDITLPFNAIRKSVEMLYYPVHYSGNEPINYVVEPDFRDILFWEPLLSIQNGNANLEVECSYETGRYVAILRGADPLGNILETSFEFTVTTMP